MDNLEDMEESVPVNVKSALVYIVGYVTRHDPELHETAQLGQTSFYHQKFGQYIQTVLTEGS